MATSQSPGASIDSVTTHGPGIFSGTFSGTAGLEMTLNVVCRRVFLLLGSLHPNIQDSDGKPKRDPQTILQILTDLLSATNHYEVCNIGSMCALLLAETLQQLALKLSTSCLPFANDKISPITFPVPLK